MSGTHQPLARWHRSWKDLERIPAIEQVIAGAVAGDERRRRYGERMPEGCRWLFYDNLELLPYFLTGLEVAAVIVDLHRWTPLEVAPVLRRLREQRAGLLIIGVHEPIGEAPAGLAELAWSDRRLAFTSDADDRFDLLIRHAMWPPAAEEPTVCQILLEHLLPLGCQKVRGALIEMAIAPSLGRSIRAMAAALGWSEDALERRYSDVGLAPPTSVRRLAVAAEGLWQIAAPQHAAEPVARALGLGGADSLGRVIKSVFGIGLKAARLMGVAGARDALRWSGLLALRDLTVLGGLSSLRHARLSVSDAVAGQPDGETLRVSRFDPSSAALSVTVNPEVWRLLCGGRPLEHLVERLSDPIAGDPQRFTREFVPAICKLLRHRLLAVRPG